MLSPKTPETVAKINPDRIPEKCPVNEVRGFLIIGIIRRIIICCNCSASITQLLTFNLSNITSPKRTAENPTEQVGKGQNGIFAKVDCIKLDKINNKPTNKA